MAVQSPAAMGFRHMWQVMRGLESESLGDGHGHGAVLKRFQAKWNPVRVKNQMSPTGLLEGDVAPTPRQMFAAVDRQHLSGQIGMRQKERHQRIYVFCRRGAAGRNFSCIGDESLFRLRPRRK